MNGATEVATYHLHTCDELGVCQSRGDCQHSSVGNVQIDDPLVELSGNEWGPVALAVFTASVIFGVAIAMLINMHWDYLTATAAGWLHQTFFTH